MSDTTTDLWRMSAMDRSMRPASRSIGPVAVSVAMKHRGELVRTLEQEIANVITA
jgi:hypothetical protein